MTGTNNRIECINQKIKSVVCKYYGMVTFFIDLKHVFSVLETECNHQTFQIAQKSSAAWSTTDAVEQRYMQLLTAYALKCVMKHPLLNVMAQMQHPVIRLSV